MEPRDAALEAFSYDWQAHEQTIEIDGRNLRYVQLGDPANPPLLFVHGIMGSWQHWVFNLREFADRFHVIAVDLPGFGESEMPASPLDMHAYARTLTELCGRLGLAGVTLIGNSMGGLVGAVLAKTSPQLLERLVLVDAAGFSTATGWLTRIPLLARILDPGMRLVRRTYKTLNRSRILAGLLLWWCVAHPFKLARDVSLMLLSGSGRPGFVPAADSIMTTPVQLTPGEIAVPTLIVWGRKDYFIPRRDAFAYMRICPDSDVRIIDDAAHLPMLERPAEFNALVDEFVSAPAVAADQSVAAPPAEAAA